MENNALPKNEAEAAQKQKHVIEDHVRTPKRNWDVEQTAPKRDLHDEQDADRHNIREGVIRKLLAWIDRYLPELGQLLPDKADRTQYLDREHEQIGNGFRAFVVRLHRQMI